MGKTPPNRRTPLKARKSPVDVSNVDENGKPFVNLEPDLTPSKLVEIKEETMALLQSDKATDREAGALQFATMLRINRTLLTTDEDVAADGTKRTNSTTNNQLNQTVKSHLGDICRTIAPLLLDEKPFVRAAAAEALG